MESEAFATSKADCKNVEFSSPVSCLSSHSSKAGPLSLNARAAPMRSTISLMLLRLWTFLTMD
eukprot:5339951-Pyramimonas_sp.AAC.1